MKNVICITCPKGCHLTVDEENGFAVTGNSCPRGAEYGKNELQRANEKLSILYPFRLKRPEIRLVTPGLFSTKSDNACFLISENLPLSCALLK